MLAAEVLGIYQMDGMARCRIQFLERLEISDLPVTHIKKEIFAGAKERCRTVLGMAVCATDYRTILLHALG